MRISEQLKLLARGIHPETGEVLEPSSLTHKPESIRVLYELALELATEEKPRKSKPKLSPEERRQKNLEEGRPARSHFPWEDEEKLALKNLFEKSKNFQQLAEKFERSKIAIAVQLQNQGLLTEDEVAAFR